MNCNSKSFLTSFMFFYTSPTLLIPPNTYPTSSSLKHLTFAASHLCSHILPNSIISLHTISHPSHTSKPTISIEEEPKSYISLEFCSRVLSACNSKSSREGVSVHGLIIKLGFQDDLFLNNNLISLYSKCIGSGHARKLFDEMSQRDVVSWTAVLSAYVRDRNYEAAIEFFDFVVGSGFIANEYTFSSVLRSCASLGDFECGTRVQAQIIKRGFGLHLVLGSALVDFYSKCGKACEAYKVFVGMNDQDTMSWTTMISAFVEAEDWNGALRLYCYMLKDGVPPNGFTFVKLLMASAFLGLEYGKLVHAHVILWGIELNLVLKTALVDMYSKCQSMGDALEVANQTSEADVLLWTAMISGYNQASCYNEAIVVFQQMELAEILPNSFTFAGILNACSSIPSPKLGRQIHSRTIKAGLDHDVSVGNALMDMYMKSCSNAVEEASLVFKGIVQKNVISWTCLINGLTQNGYDQGALQAYSEMWITGVKPNSFTLSSVLKGCRSLEALRQVRKLHAYIFKTKAHFGITVGNSLVDVYARFGMVDDAWRVIEMMANRDAITYTSLTAGMNQMGHHEMALDIISLMHHDNVNMDGFSLASFLSASASLAAIEPGKQLHCYSIKSGLDHQISVSNGIVDMYGKCGSVNDAYRAFQAITEPNVVSWNGLISGLASNGHFSAALSYFEDMKLVGIQPDDITFLIVLYACSHGGLVDLGLEHFKSMGECYGIPPQSDHYVCLVDLLGRGGRLEEAASVIEDMPFPPDALIYKTLLGSCKVHRNLPLGEYTASCALQMDPSDPAVYVLLSNMYDDAGKSDFGEQMRKMMRDRGLKKIPGQSWMEIRNKIHLFTAGDRSNPQINEIHQKIESLTAKVMSLGYGYVENNGSSHHSEKLALAFGLLNTPSMAPIRIIKNIRICDDCHNFIKLVTHFVDREIVVRDGNRFHFFKKGDCTCGGYW
eukprot:TRINITY_DN15363_c1_g1_i1.p1 TRINITY_DN15363_c1_g1~~TRINITY_DN15363_c1_g1_i1.p1  ORF type:complete len:948 (-),score=150.05 TRINITY_DN15363_c1_g1_i1:9-2852(-)